MKKTFIICAIVLLVSQNLTCFQRAVFSNRFYSPKIRSSNAENTYSSDADDHLNGLWKRVDVPSPLHLIVDFNIERNSVVYEVSLGREIGLEIIPDRIGLAVVGEVLPGSRAESIGILPNDVIVASSATAGTKMWSHNSVDGVKSALSTRFVMSPSVKIRFERNLNSIPVSVVRLLKVPQYFNVIVRRPIGMHVEEGDDKSVVVKRLTPELGAARTRRIEVGDQIVSMSASWGDRMWEVNSVESFVVGVRLRTDTQLTFRMKRILPLAAYRGQLEARQVHSRGVSFEAKNAAAVMSSSVMAAVPSAVSAESNNATPLSGQTVNDDISDDDIAYSSPTSERQQQQVNADSVTWSPSSPSVAAAAAAAANPVSKNVSTPPLKVLVTLSEQIDKAKTKNQLSQLWLSWSPQEKARLSAYDVNKFMSVALALETPALAVRVFEDMCGFVFAPPDSAAALTQQLDKAMLQSEGSDNMFWSAQGATSFSPAAKPLLKPNNFICTTATKAYGRNLETDKAIALLPWLEQQGEAADIYFLSALLYVCAKDRRVKVAEHLFWHEIPRRNLTYAVATTNSIMYMYARQNRPDDALRVYDMTKRLGIKCTVVTYGVLIKALLRSGRKQLQDASYEILRSLPEIGIVPGIEVYNQFLEHFSSTHDFRQTKIILKLMSRSAPKVKPDALSYGYVINCFADSKKPRSALAAYRQMRNSKIESNAFTYMGVLKALFHLRDGISSVQVLTEMREVGVVPDKRHQSMAMFTCVASDMCPLAESIFHAALKSKQRPDTALYTLYLRALLQQSKWDEAETLLNRMVTGKDAAKPNSLTLNYYLQYQMLGGRWAKAEDTLSIIVEGVSKSASLSTPTRALNNGNLSNVLNKKSSAVTSSASSLEFPASTLQQTYQRMSLALGSYSVALQRLNQEENLRLQRAEADLRGEDDSFFSPDQYDYMSAPKMKIEKPSKAALRFLVQATLKLSHLDHGYVAGDFYAELLRALAMEGEPWIAQDVMKTLQSKVRVKVDDQERVASAEEIVNKVCLELGKAGRTSTAGKWLSDKV